MAVILADSECTVCRTDRGLGFTEYRMLDNGVELGVGFGGDNQLHAWTRRHLLVAEKLPRADQLTEVIIDWILKRSFKRQTLARLQFRDNRTVATGTSIHPAIYRPTLSNNPEITRQHPVMYANVFRLRKHGEWPVRISDLQTDEAQRFTGYFFGHPIHAHQMEPIAYGHDNAEAWRDSSVTIGDEPWEPPFDTTDDCQFCLKMTDDSIRERLAAYQWAIDKEVYGFNTSRVGRDYPDYGKASYTRRMQHHQEREEWLAENPNGLRAVNLLLLPFELQRMLVIRWNHIVRDFLNEDPRYVYDNGEYYVVFTERIGGPDMRPTRSEPVPSPLVTGNYVGMLTENFVVASGWPWLFGATPES